MNRETNKVKRTWHAAPSRRTVTAVLMTVVMVSGCGGSDESGAAADEASSAAAPTQSAMVRLWAAGTPAFGVYVPSERERGARGPDGERLPPLYTVATGVGLAANPLLDYAFLNLEGMYDPQAVMALAEGMAGSDKTLLVRIPPVSADGVDATRARVAEILGAGAQGIVIPHVRSLEEARTVVSFFTDIGADVWSPQNPDGTILAMLMLEDPEAIAATTEIATIPGYSALACGIGSLTGALDGDREAAEALNQEVLAQATQAGLADMITANADDIAKRIDDGFLGLLMSGPESDATIQLGRSHAGR